MMKRSLLYLLLTYSVVAYSQTPPVVIDKAVPLNSAGNIGNDALKANTDVVAIQGVKITSDFMKKGSVVCDKNDTNCRSVWGVSSSGDTLDFNAIKKKGESQLGASSFQTRDKDGNSTAITAQVVDLVLACGDDNQYTPAGVAWKMTTCTVNANGTARVGFKSCTATARGLPVKNKPNATVDCTQKDASGAFLKPPPGKSCLQVSCDTEPEDSFNGWSSEVLTESFDPTIDADTTKTADQKAANGLGLNFYPKADTLTSLKSYDPNAGDTMVAVKIVKSFYDTKVHQGAVALRVAYRYTAKVGNDNLAYNATAVSPDKNSPVWNTITTLQDINREIPVGDSVVKPATLEKKYAAQNRACFTKMMSHLDKTVKDGADVQPDGKVELCDKTYTGEGNFDPTVGRRPQDEGSEIGGVADCSTTSRCLTEVTKSLNTTKVCNSDVPLSKRSCTTTITQTTPVLNFARTRPEETCEIKRNSSTVYCNNEANATVTDINRVLADQLCLGFGFGANPGGEPAYSQNPGYVVKYKDVWMSIATASNGSKYWCKYIFDVGCSESVNGPGSVSPPSFASYRAVALAGFRDLFLNGGPQGTYTDDDLENCTLKYDSSIYSSGYTATTYANAKYNQVCGAPYTCTDPSYPNLIVDNYGTGYCRDNIGYNTASATPTCTSTLANPVPPQVIGAAQYDASSWLKPNSNCSEIGRSNRGITASLCRTKCSNVVYKGVVCGTGHTNFCWEVWECEDDIGGGGDNTCPDGWIQVQVNSDLYCQQPLPPGNCQIVGTWDDVGELGQQRARVACFTSVSQCGTYEAANP